MTYLDSSVLLAVYLGQPRADRGRAILRDDPTLVSSWLLAVEVPIVLRRALGHPDERSLLAAALDRFDQDLRAISLVDGLPEVARRVRADRRLSGCRLLDAVHAATALIVMEASGRPIVFATFDERLAAVVAGLGLQARG